MDFAKLQVHLKGYFEGRDYFYALMAFEFAKKFHTGKRKDGKTNEIQHQYEICMYIISLKLPSEIEQLVLVAILLHDIMEDYDLEKHDIVNLFGSKPKDLEFGQKTYDAVWKLTKVHKGIKKNPLAYFADIATCPIASIAKGGDRNHNLQSMVGVFSLVKVQDYSNETKNFFLNMIKQAKYNFPEYGMVFLNIQQLMKYQLSLIDHYIEAKKEAEKYKMLLEKKDKVKKVKNNEIILS